MPASNNKKKYTLFASANAEAGAKPPCAFFASAAGCRSGDNCKFSHLLANAPAKPAADAAAAESAPMRHSLETSSVVSSESEASKKDDGKDVFVTMADMKKQKEEASNKKRRGKRAEVDDPFANPKTKVAKTTATASPKSAPSKKESAPTKKEKSTPPPAVVTTTRQQSTPTPTTPAVSGFRAMALPIAAFSCMPESKKSGDVDKASSDSTPEPPTPKAAKPAPPAPEPKKESSMHLPKSNPVGRKWLPAILQTSKHARFERSYDFSRYQQQDEEVGLSASAWIEAKPYSEWCAKNPQVIAMDCEMCETCDPVSGLKDCRALCRISVVDVTTNEVLLDTLVKPAWPVSDYRTWVNGIGAEHLDTVQFTLRHAQAFMMALCSQETVILGHALENDLAAIRMTHQAVVDSAYLYPVKDSPNASISLKDLTKSILEIDMPKTHDSVNDARMSMECLKVWLKKGGKVEPIVRVATASYAQKLFVHRIPKKTCEASHLSRMFLHHTTIEPVSVEDIEFGSNDVGKTYILFKTGAHASLAFDSLEGKAEPDATGKLQKKVFLKNGGYVRVRKMVREKGDDLSPLKKSETA
jgi:RNA exonuclease 1